MNHEFIALFFSIDKVPVLDKKVSRILPAAHCSEVQNSVQKVQNELGETRSLKY